MTTPTGKLAWGQAANYDASDDRAVITAVTAGRVGLVRPVVVAAGAGLQVIIRGGWVGVASCDDLTSAVVGSREEHVVTAVPGPASGSREDVVWCDTNPDEGTWELSVIPRAATASRSGIPLVWITAGAGSNLASQMTIRPVDASVERRLMSYTSRSDTTVYTSTTFAGSVAQSLDSFAVTMEPGQWYRVRYLTNSAQLVAAAGGLIANGECRIGVGYRTAGQAPVTAQLGRAAALQFSRIASGPSPAAQQAECEWVFRHSESDTRYERVFSGRIWATIGGAQYRPNQMTSEGAPQMLTVEDIGS
jgi:hypothetical protein